MDIVFLLKSLIGLILLLGVLVIVFFYHPYKKRKHQQMLKEVVTTDCDYTFDQLSDIIKLKRSSAKELGFALDTIIKFYGNIPPKKGIRLHDDFYKYSELIIRLSHHPHATKDLILNFDRELQKNNPQYAKEINNALTQGINSRNG